MKSVLNKINFMKLLERRNLGEAGHRELEVHLDIKTGEDAVEGYQGLSSFVSAALSGSLDEDRKVVAVVGNKKDLKEALDKLEEVPKVEEEVAATTSVYKDAHMVAPETKAEEAEEAPAAVEPKKPAKKATSTKEAKPRIRASKEVLFSRETDGHKKLVSHFLTEQFGTKWKVQPLLAKVVEANKTSVNLPFLTEDGMEVLESFKAQYLAKLED